MRRFSIKAWGSDIHPDLHYEADVVDEVVRTGYPCISIALNVPILHSELIKKMEEGLEQVWP